LIFRRRRIRIEIEENTLTLGPAGSISASPVPREAHPAPTLLPSTSEPNPPLTAKGKSIPEGTRHVR
jgi:hypothetical protein